MLAWELDKECSLGHGQVETLVKDVIGQKVFLVGHSIGTPCRNGGGAIVGVKCRQPSRSMLELLPSFCQQQKQNSACLLLSYGVHL